MGTELLERESHLDALAWWWDEAVAGEGRLVFVGGEAGAGKTSLVRRFETYVSSGARVLAGDCEPLATPVPLGPLLDMATALPGDLQDALTGGSAPIEARRAFLRAVDSVLAGTLVVVEDVHWADEATLDLVRYVGRRLAGKRVMVVATYRDDAVGARHPLRVLMGDMATLPFVRRLAVGPLSPEAVARLAEGSGLDAGNLHRRTGGNPFFVTEVLSTGEAVLPATVRDAVLARVARLSSPAREVVDAAACLGARVPPRLVQEVTGQGPEALDDCLGTGVLRCDEDGLAFGHELAREAVAQAVPPPRAAGYHARALRVLEGLSEGHLHGRLDPARMAEHAERSGDRVALLRYARAAAEQAARLAAHREAAAHYGRALSVAEGLSDEERAALFEAAATERYLSHDLHGSVDAAQAAFDLSRRLGDRRCQARSLLLQAISSMAVAEWIPRVVPLLEEAISVLEGLPATPELATAWQAKAALGILAFATDDASRAAERASGVARELDDAHADAHARLWTGLARVQRGEQAAWPLVDESVQAVLAAEVDPLSPKAAWWPYHVAVTQRRYALADRWFSGGMAFAAEHDLETIRQFFLSYRARELLDRGRWDEAEALATRAFPGSAADDGFRLIAMVTDGRLRARRGEPGARALLEEVARYEEPARAVVEWIIRSVTALAEHAWLSGDHGAISGLLEPALDRAKERGEPWWLGEVAFWLWRVGAVEQAPAGVAEPYALLLAGRWQEAHDGWLAIGCPYEAAQALSCADEEGALRQALEVFDRFGARGERDAVARRLRHLGVRHIPRMRREAGRAPEAHLSRREAEVLALVSEGLRNAEIAAKLFLSERTVEHHVASLLRKLQAHSRVDALAKARELGLLVDA